MTIASGYGGGLDYFPCRYGNSRLAFRGPRKSFEHPYVVCLGGTETYGRFVPLPFCEQLEQASGLTCLNFGIVNAGLDAVFNDPTVSDISAAASVCVIEALGAQNMSNRFYSVHPRRNDRFLRASPALLQLFPEIDFTDHVFTRALLSALAETGPDRFPLVVEELQTAWLARMKTLLTEMSGRRIVLYCAEAPPPEATPTGPEAFAVPGPLFVTRGMLDALAPRADHVAIYTPSEACVTTGTDGMVFTDFEAAAAQQVLGAHAHQEIAEVLAPLVAIPS